MQASGFEDDVECNGKYVAYLGIKMYLMLGEFSLS